MKEKLSQLFNRLASWGPLAVITESIRNKIVVSLLLVSLVPLFVLGVYSYLQSASALDASAFESLKTSQTNKAATIKGHLQNRISDMRALVETTKALRTKAYNQLRSMQMLKKSLIESYFTERFANVNVMASNPVTVDALAAFKRVSRKIGGASWREVEQVYGPPLVKFGESYGYYDAYLVSPDGLVLYTVAQESDLGQNLEDGDLKDSPAAKAFRKGLNGLSFQDFEAYEPAYGAPCAFISIPVVVEGNVQGVFMIQVSVDQINFVMQERTGLGRTGETYLVGPDNMFRSDSIHIEESTIINPSFKVESKGVAEAFEGRSGNTVTVNYRGEYVLSAWTPVRVHDQTWAMIAEIDINEAFVPTLQQEEKDYLMQYKELYGYDDIMMLNPDGMIFYSVKKRVDFRTNILKGPYQKSNLSTLVKTIKKTKAFGTADFALYKPAGDQSVKPVVGKPTAFFGIPMLGDNGEVNVIMVSALSAKIIDDVMVSEAEKDSKDTRMESYLVGPDYLFRSNSRNVEENTILNRKYEVKTEAVERALKNDPGTAFIKNYQGEKVLSSWSPLPIGRTTEKGSENAIWAVISEIPYDEVRSPVNHLFWATVFLGVVVAFFVVLGSLGLARGLTRQVDHINELFGDIGMGDFEARTPVTSQDELGEMASSLNAMLDNTLSLIQSSEERDTMQESIMRLLTEIAGLAEGNLMVRAKVTEDFTGAIADSFNDMAEQIGQVVRHVKDVTLQVSSTSQEVSTSTENLAETSENQAVQVSDAIAAINQMASSIQKVAEIANQCAQVSEQSMSHAKEGARSVNETNASMESIREHVQETARAIKRLGESSQEVGNIVQLINDIADRTSILALNASIQAAMAGDAGRGFAVVAEEVQRLAERSTNATQQIDTLIKNIQGEINEAGSSMEESIQQVVEGSKLADTAHGKLQDIESVTVNLGELIQSISMASKQQARASENLAKAMEDIGEISAQTSAASRQTAVSMKSLADMSDQLNESVSVFRIDEADDN